MKFSPAKARLEFSTALLDSVVLRYSRVEPSNQSVARDLCSRPILFIGTAGYNLQRRERVASGSIGGAHATLEHDPEKCEAAFPRDKRGTRLRGDHAQTKR
jgi:hypothetical protein